MHTNQKGDIAYIVLSLLAVAGVVTALAVAPGLGAVLKIIDPNPRKAAAKVERALRGLIRRGSVKHYPQGYKITKKGELELLRRKFEKYEFANTKKENRKYRVLCFDIPEKRKGMRIVIRQKLVELGFYRLQDSVYVTLHDCSEFLELIHRAFYLHKYVRVLVVDSIDDDQEVRAHFGY